MTSELWLKVIAGLMTIISGIFTYVLIPYLKQKTTMQQRENAEFWIRIAVQAAEQVFSLPESGKEKKEFVVNYLKNMGIALSKSEIDSIIESIVYEINLLKTEVMQ